MESLKNRWNESKWEKYKLYNDNVKYEVGYKYLN